MKGTFKIDLAIKKLTWLFSERIQDKTWMHFHKCYWNFFHQNWSFIIVIYTDLVYVNFNLQHSRQNEILILIKEQYKSIILIKI